ncbi:MAG: PAS domain-containing sensor histidine kinase [Bacteroidales bacterium]|nr:PAS domain-containing sensor histidine kinase [Bacteroidales bacterium]
MTKSDITNFIINVGILLIFRSIYDFYWVKYRETFKTLMQYATGLVIGSVGIMLMIENIGWYSGSKIFIDAKTVLLSLSGLFLGTRTTITAAIVIAGYAAYRYFEPELQFYAVDVGTDVWNADGMLIFDIYTIVISALCGILFNRFHQRWVALHEIKTLATLAWAVHLLMYLMTPVIITDQTLYNMVAIAPTILCVFPAATVLLGRLMITDATRWDLKAQLSYTEDKFNKVALCSDDCFWEIDSKGFVVYVSNTVAKIIGYSPREIIAKKPYQFLNDLESKNRILEYVLNNSNPNDIFDNELVLQHKDGAQIHCTARGMKRFDRFGNLAGYIGIIHNANEQYMQHELMRRNQMQLREQNKQYETLNNELKTNYEKINSINQDLVTAKTQLENAEQAKKNFIANISQEIKAPLATINNYLDTAANPFHKTEDHIQFITAVKQQCDDIMLLLEEISDLEKIDEGCFTVSETAGDIGYLFNEICEHYKLRSLFLNNKRIEFIHRLSIRGEKQAVKTDFAKLRIVLKNIINNACAFTDKGEIRFSCSLFNNDTEIKFEISDTGIGIDSETLKEIFSRSHQAPANTRGYGSSLGLPVAKAVVEALGGEIHVESTVGEGTTFWFTIPYKKAIIAADNQYKWKDKNAVVICKDRLLSVYITNILMKTDIHYKVYTIERNRPFSEDQFHVSYDVVLMDSRLVKSEYGDIIEEFLKDKSAPVIYLDSPENGNMPESASIYEAMAAVLSK